ncbi:TetR/AcrR family transcriptional regulator [Roseovarius sp. A21]|uniref:TetR/AcrR family transcriptional regulator n=1 Tax=Roseovarius bejariae TaxID=2576383 RepID=A0A844CM30_9RHOB|nr:TetR/AcrR family transcriptional regulator [Roseovarius bejariae]MRU15837.1 TetR/AcrR family transcriptional regulator [Roseovarius bejariae]
MTAESAEIKKGRKFEQVLNGAREVFMRDGFEGASVDDIAKVAGVSKATLYSYFPDKRLLFSEVAKAECNRQADGATAEIDIDAPVEVNLAAAARHLVGFFLSDFGSQVFRICVSEAHRFPDLGKRFYASGPALVRERMIPVLKSYADKGELEIEDYELAVNQFAELCKSDLFVRKLCGLQSDFSQEDVDRVIEGAVEMFVARYGTRSKT